MRERLILKGTKKLVSNGKFIGVVQTDFEDVQYINESQVAGSGVDLNDDEAMEYVGPLSPMIRQSGNQSNKGGIFNNQLINEELDRTKKPNADIEN